MMANNLDFALQNYYRIENIDNPDQRIAHDANLFCRKLGDVSKAVAAIPFGVVLYSYLTYNLTHSVAILFTAYGSFIASFIILK